MALLSAGKSMFGGAVNQGFFDKDPEKIAEKEKKAKQYREQLKQQAQQHARRKKQQKLKQQKDDQRLQRQFYEQKAKQQNQLKKQQQKNQQRKQLPKQQSPKIQQKAYMNASASLVDSKLSYPITYEAYPIHYNRSQLFNNNNGRLNQLKHVLDTKLQDLLREINRSRDYLQLDYEIERIRKKMHFTQQYEEQKTEQSHSAFYRAPRKAKAFDFQPIDQSFSRNDNYGKVTRNSRTQSSYHPKKWESVKKENIFKQPIYQPKLSNGAKYTRDKQALDLQIDLTMNKIDTILQTNQK